MDFPRFSSFFPEFSRIFEVFRGFSPRYLGIGATLGPLVGSQLSLRRSFAASTATFAATAAYVYCRVPETLSPANRWPGAAFALVFPHFSAVLEGFQVVFHWISARFIVFRQVWS